MTRPALFPLCKFASLPVNEAFRIGQVELGQGRRGRKPCNDCSLATVGEEGAPKTRAARRVVHLRLHVGAVLRSIKPLHAKAEMPVFVNKLSQRIKLDQFRKDQWYRALRALNIRPRDFYSCKDTAISLDITAGRTRRRSRKKWEFLFQHSSAITASIWTRRCTKKCNRKCDGIEEESKKAMIQRRVMASPTGFEPKLVKKSGNGKR